MRIFFRKIEKTLRNYSREKFIENNAVTKLAIAPIIIQEQTKQIHPLDTVLGK